MVKYRKPDMKVIKGKLRSAIIAGVLLTLIFLKFIPQQVFWSYIVLAISITMQTGVCINAHVLRIKAECILGEITIKK